MSPHQSTSAASFASFVQDNRTILGQALEFVGEMDAEKFARPHPDLGLSSIGSHLRHILDFYARFFEAIECAPSNLPLVDYDRRERDPRLETDPRLAAWKLEQIMTKLEALPPSLARYGVTVKTDNLLPGEGFTSVSSIERELQAMLSHTVHHYALIKIAAGRVGIDPGRGFGVAPSTLRYWEQSGACAP